MTDTITDLTDLTDRLEQAAARLRAGDLDSDEAASLVDECARLAGEATAELDRLARVQQGVPAAQPGLLSRQDPLL